MKLPRESKTISSEADFSFQPTALTKAAVTLNICTEDSSEFTPNFLSGHGVTQKLHKGRKIRLLRRFTPVEKQTTLLGELCQQRIKRLPFAMLYYKAKCKNEDYRRDCRKRSF
jgi:hypothetical protein